MTFFVVVTYTQHEICHCNHFKIYNSSQARWCMLAILTTHKVDARGPKVQGQSELSPYLKIKIKTKGLGAKLKRQNACLAHTRAWVRSPLLQKRQEQRIQLVSWSTLTILYNHHSCPVVELYHHSKSRPHTHWADAQSLTQTKGLMDLLSVSMDFSLLAISQTWYFCVWLLSLHVFKVHPRCTCISILLFFMPG